MALMKLGLKALVIALVMALAAVPAAFAGKGGHGGGKPSWAGQGKPSWAGSGHASGKAHHEQKAKKPKHHQEGAGAEDDSADEVDLEGLNPAWYCKTISDEATKLAQDFASMFGTNPNGANAFGKCVSQRAHDLNGSEAAGGDGEQGADSPCEASGTNSDDAAADSESCESNDSDADEPAGEEQSQGDDEQGEDDQGQDEDDVSGELDSSDLAAALRFLRL